MVGIIVVVAWVGFQFVRMSDEVDNFVRSGPDQASEFVVDHRVDWTVFVEPDRASLTGVRFRIWDVDASREVTMRPYGGSFSYGFMSHSGRAIATVSLEPGTYSLQVDGSGLDLALGPSPASRTVWMILGGLVIGVPMVIGGAVLATVSALRESRRRNRMAAMPPVSTWSAGEWPGSGR